MKYYTLLFLTTFFSLTIAFGQTKETITDTTKIEESIAESFNFSPEEEFFTLKQDLNKDITLLRETRLEHRVKFFDWLFFVLTILVAVVGIAIPLRLEYKKRELEIKIDKTITETNSQIKSTIQEANSRIDSTIQEANSQVKSKLHEVNSEVKSAIQESNSRIDSTIQGANSRIESTIQGANSRIDSTIQESNSRIDSTIQGANSRIKSFIQEANSEIESTIQGANSRIDSTIQGANSRIKSFIQEANSEIESTKNKAEKAVQAINDYLSNVKESSENIIKKYEQKLRVLSESTGNLELGNINLHLSQKSTKELEEIISDPDTPSPEKLWAEALIQFNNDKYSETINLLNSLIEKNSTNLTKESLSSIYFILGNCYYLLAFDNDDQDAKANNTIKATQFYTSSITLNESNSKAWYNKALAFAKLKDILFKIHAGDYECELCKIQIQATLDHFKNKISGINNQIVNLEELLK